MKVKELIKYLKTQNQELDVCYGLYSEYCILNQEDIDVLDLCVERPDGWIHRPWPDKESKQYLVLP